MKSLTSLRLTGVLLAISFLGMSTSVFAASRPVNALSMPSHSSSIQTKNASVDFTINKPLVSTVPGTSLTPSQVAQAVLVANNHALTASNGTVSVSAQTLKTSGLSFAQIQWVEAQMTSFDVKVQTGTVLAPTSNAPIPVGLLATLPGAPHDIVRPFSTGNMAFSWYISSKPEYVSISRWYGRLYVLNNTGTLQLIKAINAISTGLSVGSAVSLFIPMLDGVGAVAELVGAFGSGAGALINSVNNRGYDFGVNFPMVAALIPVWVKANNPD